MSDSTSSNDVVALRPFVPAKDFEISLRFYQDLGFAAKRLDPGLAVLELGLFSFLLQKYDAPDFAGHYMMQLLVNDLPTWWAKIEALDLSTRYGVQPPRAPAVQPWGLTVAYVFEPGGVLWHIVQNP
jgi:hypothetical protein